VIVTYKGSGALVGTESAHFLPALMIRALPIGVSSLTT
jgi:hypothetical protein